MINHGLLAFCLGSFLLVNANNSAAAGANPPCTVSMTNVSFGAFTLSGSPIDTTGTLTVSCPAGGGPDQYVCLSIGVDPGGDATSRMMLDGTNGLRYDLYKDAARTQKWGSWETGYAGTGVQTIALRGVPQDITVYARVFGSQSTPPGSYSSFFAMHPYLTSKDNSGGPSCPTAPNTDSTSFTVTATVLAGCNLTATDLDFGTVGVLSSNVDAASTVSVTCSNGTPYNVGLNAGTGAGATVANRKMTSGGNTVSYSLYTDSARTTVWGNTVGTDTVAGTGTGTSQALTVYGRVPSQTTPPPSTYSDTIIVTVTY
jgi:spore coat protein U-like protein